MEENDEKKKMEGKQGGFTFVAFRINGCGAARNGSYSLR